MPRSRIIPCWEWGHLESCMRLGAPWGGDGDRDSGQRWRPGAGIGTQGRDGDPGQRWGPRAGMGTQGRDADLGCYWDHCSGWCWEGWGSNWGPAQGHFECFMKWRTHCPHRERWVHGTRVLPHPPKAICAPITSGARRASLHRAPPGSPWAALHAPITPPASVSPAVAVPSLQGDKGTVPQHCTADVGWVQDAGIAVLLVGPPARAVLLPHVSQ